jgi:hypothetical protein
MTPEEHVFVVLDHFGGESLADMLRAWKPQAWPWKRVAALGRQLCSVLHAYHACGIAHGDLSAHDCMVVHDEAGEPILRLSAICGCRPEGASDDAPAAQVLADVQAVGSLLYTALTGRPPVHGKMGVVRPSTLRPGLPATAGELEDVIVRALSNDLETRYPSAGRMYDALRRAENVSSRDPTRPLQAVGAFEVPDRTPASEARAPLGSQAQVELPPPPCRLGRAFGALTLSLAMGAGVWLWADPQLALGPSAVPDRSLSHAVVPAQASHDAPGRAAARARIVDAPPAEQPEPIALPDPPQPVPPEAPMQSAAVAAAAIDDQPRARPAPPPPPEVQQPRRRSQRNRRDASATSAASPKPRKPEPKAAKEPAEPVADPPSAPDETAAEVRPEPETTDPAGAKDPGVASRERRVEKREPDVDEPSTTTTTKTPLPRVDDAVVPEPRAPSTDPPAVEPTPSA